MSGDVDVHIPNTTGTRIMASVLTTVIGSAIVGTFALLWTMNAKLATVYTQQSSIDASFVQMRADVTDIKTRLRELERGQGSE